jgi:hypothetical protein
MQAAEFPSSPFRTTWRSTRLRSWVRRREAGVREQPECVVLEAEGEAASERPPVRIFVGTEPAQIRAERVFVWSVAQVRDRRRRYEIHLMKDLSGFDRRRWKTGFTMYRFAVPDLAGRRGRAIYNDVDQIYLSDPAELFDADMDGRGFLSISRRDTSVMLIDCTRMASLWTREDAGRRLKKFFRARAAEVPGLWGALAPEWNARDEEYVAGRSKLFHFTTLHKQPWQPFPGEIVYEENPHAELWHALERDADAAGFQVFTRERPSRRYRDLLALYREMHRAGTHNLQLPPEQTFEGKSLDRHTDAIAACIRASGARALLDYGSGKGSRYQSLPGANGSGRVKTLAAWGDVRVTCYDPAYAPFAELPGEKFDGVICTDVLEHVPEEDVPWVVDELFAHASRFVYAAVSCSPARKQLPNGQNAHCAVRAPEWWKERFASAAARFPGVAWRLHTRRRGWLRKVSRVFAGT